MATTEDRLQEVEELEQLYASPPRAEARPLEWYRGLLIGWIAVFGSIVLFEPAPADPNAAVPAWGTALVTVFTLALIAGFVGLARSRPWGLQASVVAGALGVAIGVACMVTDHHAGFWGAYELIAFSGLTGASLIATKETAKS